RLGGFEAIGPVLQGLAKPISDLSRGANEEDVYKAAIITAAQAMA
ncbi:MAG: phosphate acyltransferase, partial [Weissella confusa]